MFTHFKQLVLFVAILFTLTGCAGTDPYVTHKNYFDSFYDSTDFNRALADSEFELGQQEFLDTLKLAEQGNAEAQYAIGFSYLRGTPAPRDLIVDPEKYDALSYLRGTHLSQAVDWIRKSAKQDNPNGQTLLGHLYRYGIGVVHDPAQELFWYTKAAANGERNAQNALGMKYLYGIGVSRDPAHGLELLGKSATSGNLSAQNHLDYLRRRAEQVEQRAINKMAGKAAAKQAVRMMLR